MSQHPYQAVRFAAKDGFELSGRLYLAADSKRYLLIASAFGVPNRYYRHFANFMAQNDLNVLVFDYRGIGDSQQGKAPFDKMKIEDWAQLDIEAAFQFLKSQGAESIDYLGHSYGGQVIGLVSSCEQLNKIIIAASGIGHWRLWPGLYKFGMLLVWKLIFPIAMLFRRKPLFNSYLLGKVPVPRNVVKGWLKWARSDQYLFTPVHKLNLSRYPKLRQPLLAVSVTDDLYAPIGVHNALIRHYVNAELVPELRVNPKDTGLKKIGHFGLFKKKQEIEQALWQPMLNFLNGKSS